MSFIFFNCYSLSSLPDISKWNINNVIRLNCTFSRCVSLLSMPDITKWKTKNLEEMFFIFSDCLNLLSLPDITQWNNYNEDNTIPDYKKLSDKLNYKKDFHELTNSTNNNLFFNNIELMNKIGGEGFENYHNNHN